MLFLGAICSGCDSENSRVDSELFPESAIIHVSLLSLCARSLVVWVSLLEVLTAGPADARHEKPCGRQGVVVLPIRDQCPQTEILSSIVT